MSAKYFSRNDGLLGGPADPQKIAKLVKGLDLYQDLLHPIVERHKIELRHIVGPDRHASVTAARHACFRVLREQAKLSFPEIGRLMDRDHTTVMSALRRPRDITSATQALEAVQARPINFRIAS